MMWPNRSNDETQSADRWAVGRPSHRRRFPSKTCLANVSTPSSKARVISVRALLPFLSFRNELACTPAKIATKIVTLFFTPILHVRVTSMAHESPKKPSMMLVSGTFVLCLWWSLWSLADAYLLSFTPWSEMIVLALCAIAIATIRSNRCSWCCTRCKAVDEQLEKLAKDIAV